MWKSIRQIDWRAIFTSALVLIVALWFVYGCPSLEILSPEGWTALATVVLAIATILLWNTTHISAVAARDAAEAVPITERAYIFVKVIDTSFGRFFDDGTADDKSGSALSVRFTLCNHGRTPAMLKQVFAGLEPMRSIEGVPTRAVDAELLKIDGSFLVIEAGKELAHSVTVTSKVDNWDAYFAGRRVRLFGLVAYEDVFGKKRETEFSLRFEGKPNGIFELLPEERNRRT